MGWGETGACIVQVFNILLTMRCYRGPIVQGAFLELSAPSLSCAVDVFGRRMVYRGKTRRPSSGE